MLRRAPQFSVRRALQQSRSRSARSLDSRATDRAGASRGERAVGERGDLVLAQTRVAGPEQTARRSCVARDRAPWATLIANHADCRSRPNPTVKLRRTAAATGIALLVERSPQRAASRRCPWRRSNAAVRNYRRDPVRGVAMARAERARQPEQSCRAQAPHDWIWADATVRHRGRSLLLGARGRRAGARARVCRRPMAGV